MKHIKKYNENNADLEISGLKCDNPTCDYNDPSVPLSDYEKSINKPCPKCGESLLTQSDYDQVMQMVQAVELMNSFSKEDLDKMVNNLSEEDIDKALDVMNQLKLKKTGEDDNGIETWSGSLGKDIRENKHIKMFVETNLTTNSKFIAELFQSGGCDYTIACGTKVVNLESTNIDDATNELNTLIEEEYRGDFRLSKATLYEIKSEHKVNLKEIYDGAKKRKEDRLAAEAEKKEREDYERLSKKFGNK